MQQRLRKLEQEGICVLTKWTFTVSVLQLTRCCHKYRRHSPVLGIKPKKKQMWCNQNFKPFLYILTYNVASADPSDDIFIEGINIGFATYYPEQVCDTKLDIAQRMTCDARSDVKAK